MVKERNRLYKYLLPFALNSDLPIGSYGSCAVELRPGEVIISGGRDEETSVYVWDVDGGEVSSVTTIPTLPQWRGDHVCGLAPSVFGPG